LPANVEPAYDGLAVKLDADSSSERLAQI
jgi:hypothetical protein